MGAALDLDAYELLAATTATEEPTRIEAVPDVDWSPHKPFAKQLEFIEAEEFEVGYGGAAGGGKSDGMLMDALKDVNVPQFSALILRKTYQDLAQDGGLMDRAHDWLGGTAARWNGTDHRWTFPSGATLSFGYLPNAAARYRYQGGEWQAIYFDELTQLLKNAYLYLRSRVRRTHGVLDNVRLRIRSGTNPGGEGHEWVKERFGLTDDGTQDEALAWDEERGEVRRFIRAGLKDNPFIDAEEYLKALGELDEETKAHLRDGLWIIGILGRVLPLTDANLVTKVPSTDMRNILSIDLGSSEAVKSLAFSVLSYSRKIEDLVWCRHVEKHTRMLNRDIAKTILDLRDEFGGFDAIVADLGALGVQFGEEMRRRHFLPIQPAQKSGRIAYSRLLHDAAIAGDLLLLDHRTKELQTEAKSLIWKDDGKAMVGECHAYDATMYGYREARAFMSRADDLPPLPGTEEAAKLIEHQDMLRAERRRAANEKKKWWKR